MRRSTFLSASVATLSIFYVAQNVAIGSQPQPIVLVQEGNTDEISNQPPTAADLPPEVTEPSQAVSENQQVPQEQQPKPESTEPAGVSASEPEAPTETVPTTDSSSVATAEPEAEQPAEPVVVNVSSAVIEYQYGVIQVGITAEAGKITQVQMLQGDTGYGRGDTYASLINATISAQGTNFGNYSGATFTTEAFRDAVASAISKL